jgi:hypothetical protein
MLSETRRLTTDAGAREADGLVIAFGADYDFDGTPGPSTALVAEKKRFGSSRRARWFGAA